MAVSNEGTSRVVELNTRKYISNRLKDLAGQCFQLYSFKCWTRSRFFLKIESGVGENTEKSFKGRWNKFLMRFFRFNPQLLSLLALLPRKDILDKRMRKKGPLKKRSDIFFKDSFLNSLEKNERNRNVSISSTLQKKDTSFLFILEKDFPTQIRLEVNPPCFTSFFYA